jgi:hypothetical protein
MSDTEGNEAKPEKIELGEGGERQEESKVPRIRIGERSQFEKGKLAALPPREKASLEIARWVLIIFAGVYILCFTMSLLMIFFVDGVDFQNSTELVRFLLGSVLPLVTLAVGYYLGDKSSSPNS